MTRDLLLKAEVRLYMPPGWAALYGPNEVVLFIPGEGILGPMSRGEFGERISRYWEEHSLPADDADRSLS